jgi:hypothetical protein
MCQPVSVPGGSVMIAPVTFAVPEGYWIDVPSHVLVVDKFSSI